MTWSVETIEKSCLGGPIGALALSPEEIVAAFNRVEDQLGQSWLQAHVSDGSNVPGTLPTLAVVSMGQRLAVLDGVPGADKLLKKIRQRDASAEAELAAIHIVRRSPDIQVEIEPQVGTRVPDFRVRKTDGVWTYVEVTFPNWSAATKRANEVLDSVSSLVYQIKSSFALEVFLRREPTQDELGGILATTPTFCSQQGKHQTDLPDNLGFLVLNGTKPGQVVLDDYGEELRPRLGMLKAISGPDEPFRHTSVRMAYSDQRATTFLDSEAAQLSPDAPGLIMIVTNRAPGSMKDWEALIAKQFNLNLHTQASGICLFSGGVLPTPKGFATLLQTKLFENPTARIDLPGWLTTAVVDAGIEYEQLSNPKDETADG